MRIAIDATSIPPRPAGAGTYIYNLVLALGEVDQENDYFIFARRGAFPEGLAPNLHLIPLGLPTRPLRLAWEQSLLPLYLRRLRVDLLHSPHHTLPWLAGGVKRVVTFHDVTFFLLPGRYPPLRGLYFRLVSRLSARLADAIIAVSHRVKEDIVRVLRVPEGRVHVVPEAPGLRPDDEESSPPLPHPYILSVGTLEPGKNHRALLRAFSRLKGKGLAHKLVIVGQRGWMYEGLPRLVAALGLEGDVLFPGYLPREELARYYRGAALFVFPSLYEGFGLPPLEAMAFGLPVVASAAGALPEVLGDGALLVDPKDDEALAAAMERALTDEGLRRELKRRGLARARRFSWQETARRTIAIYRAVLGEG